MSPGLTKVHFIPNLGSVNLNKFTVFHIIVRIQLNDHQLHIKSLQLKIALIPDDVANAAVLPSSEATLSSKTATVGLDILL